MYGNGIALVTGAAGGLGRATAVMLANKGFKVTFADMRFKNTTIPVEMASLVKNRDNAYFHAMNIVDSESVSKTFKDTITHFGEPPSLVVHCAGITASHPLFTKNKEVHPLQLFSKMLEINTTGTFNVSRIAAHNMLSIDTKPQKERGMIITTSSMTGFQGGPKQIAYSASKAAVIGMTLPFARALGEYGIRYNSISPGMFYTPMIKGYEEIVNAMVDLIPFPKRLGTPDDFTQVVNLLMKCSLINGAIIRVDGGIRL